jgi:predicted RNase H-like HicB family nuclease
MMTKTYLIWTEWDPQALVWVASSDDVPGLATEADTFDALNDKLTSLVPELLAENDPESIKEGVVLEVLARRVTVAVADTA